MHPTTTTLARTLKNKSTSAEDKIKLLEGKYAGETAYLLACGPSLSEYTALELHELLSDKLVICVKQALDYVEGITDYLLLNTWNFRRYDLADPKPIVIKEHGPTDPPVFMDSDIELVVPRPSGRDQQLALSRKFDDYTFDRQIERPWGPGVLYEIGFYLALHMGVKSMVTLGWDVGVRNSPQMPHFYDTTSPETAKIIKAARAIEDMGERNRMLHEAGVVYNRPRIIPEEVDDCAAVSGDWYDWLTAKGVDLKIVSTQSLASDRIPRTRLEAIG